MLWILLGMTHLILAVVFNSILYYCLIVEVARDFPEEQNIQCNARKPLFLHVLRNIWRIITTTSTILHESMLLENYTIN